MSTLTLFKLLSGEEVVAKVVRETNDSLFVEDAVTLVYQQAGGGKMTVGFAPFMPYAEGAVELYVSSISSRANPTSQIQDEHTRVFTGIELAPGPKPLQIVK